MVCGTALAGCILSAPADERPRWANPEVFAVNREPAHAFSLVFSDEASARPEPNWENPFAGSSRYQLLNGDWKFKWTENLSTAPVDFDEPGFNVSGWDEIPVPLPWQMAGYDQLYYFNADLPMLKDPRNQMPAGDPQKDVDNSDMLVNPQNNFRKVQVAAAKEVLVPTVFNPVGSYVTEFTMPDEWGNQRVVLHFEGVKSAFTCWINGQEVGYSQDSFSASEFDITPYIQKGSNRLAVQVLCWSDGTYLENQDRIRMCGIIRDVYLFATPKVHIGDFYLLPQVAKELDQADVRLDFQLRNTSSAAAAGYEAEIELIDPAGRTVFTEAAPIPSVAASETRTITLSKSVDSPKLWHPEAVHLYTALIKLKHDGNVTEVIRQDVGFRRFEWDESGNIYLNGKRYYMRGVNRSDCSPETGYSVSYADMLADAQLMRRLNINNVRTSHNPNDPRWVALCNRYGITLLSEANLEAHTHEEIFSDPECEPKWTPQAVFRMQNMVQAHKNNPSIILWSIGNEQFDRIANQPTVRAMYDAAKAIDPSRGVFCERMFDIKQNDSLDHFLDFIGPMYRGKEIYVQWNESGQDRRPFFMSEYAHAMGNSMADLAAQWDYFEQHDGLNGGQIWDWRDQAVLHPLPGLEGRHFTYGGDWGEPCGSGRVFCMNGITFPDRGLNAKSFQTWAVYQQVAFDSVDADSVRIKNKFATRNLNEFDIEWTLLENGDPIRNGTLDIDLAPLSETTVPMPCAGLDLKSGARCDLNFDVKLRSPEMWAPAGYVIAAGQISVRPGDSKQPELPVPDGTVLVNETTESIELQAGDVTVLFDRQAAVLSQITVGGTRLLAPDAALPGLELNTNTKVTDDRLMWPGPHGAQLNAGLNRLERKPGQIDLLETGEGFARVKAVADYLVPGKSQGLRHTAIYSLLATGEIQVDNRVQKIDLEANALRFRIGVRLPVAKTFDISEYAALGPYENYAERKECVRYGHFTAGADEFFQHYVRPQECGNRSGLDWIALRNQEGLGLVLVPSETADGSVMPWTREEMETAGHVPELPASRRWILRCDAKLAILPKQSNVDFAGDMAFSYSIRPLRRGTSPAAVAAPAIPEALTAPIPLTGKAVSPGLPEGWVCISKDATVTYSSRSERFAIHPDTLLTTQASPFAFHTDEETEPWVMIDLKKEEPVIGLEILNREPDFYGRGKNLHVWVSNDRKNWIDVFQTLEPREKWLVQLNEPKTARYVKIGLLSAAPQFFHLKGVMVYTRYQEAPRASRSLPPREPSGSRSSMTANSMNTRR
jgi:beta-galactosidase